jgi:hypothetical protein
LVDPASSLIRIRFGIIDLGVSEIPVKTIHILGISTPAFIQIIVIFFDILGAPSGAFNNCFSLKPPPDKIAAMLEGGAKDRLSFLQKLPHN